MAESKVHSDLVRLGIDYIKTIVPTNFHYLIQSDLPEVSIKPERTVDNHVPDIRLEITSVKIIGEAKTDEDTMRLHSIGQYESYLNECRYFNGISHLVIITSLFASPGITNYLRKKKRELGLTTTIHIINTTFPGSPKIL